MKLRTILSSIVLVFFGLLACSSFEEHGNISPFVWVAIVVLAILIIGIGIYTNVEETQRFVEKKKLEEWKQKEAEQAERYQLWYKEYVANNGQPDKTIFIKANDINEVIHVHEATQLVYIQGKTYKFKDIISCTFSDNPTTIKGRITATTKSNTGSALGRALVGDIVGGTAGAIIGGTTGKKTTEFHQENDHTFHDYIVIININSISTPILRILTGRDGRLTNEIVGLMNVIIARK